ncbi:MAG TPA: hypothetical protein VG797_03885 [Phycisphaerales bacterium]|nr:hypothetical protein [Phycisphaerales bacterium]
MKGFSLSRLWTATVLTVLTAAGGYVAYRMVRGEVVARVYRAKLETLVADYEKLRGTYNEAIRRTAVTELVVKNGELCVIVRDASGGFKTIETPFDPTREIFVDYAVIDGRLLVRRVFDDRTPPAQALVVEPSLAAVDWDAPGAAHGKAIYRTLGEGRWMVSVTGNGSLGLVRAEDGATATMVASPEVKDYAKMLTEADSRVEEIGAGDVIGALLGN